MKTKYFIDLVKSLGVRLSDDTEGIDIYNSDNDSRLARVSYIHDRRFVVSLDSDSGLTKSEQKMLAELVVEYGMTPLEERKDEERWHIHLSRGGSEYLNQDKETGAYELDTKYEINDYKTKFTRSEIAEYLKTDDKAFVDSFIKRFGEEV